MSHSVGDAAPSILLIWTSVLDSKAFSNKSWTTLLHRTPPFCCIIQFLKSFVNIEGSAIITMTLPSPTSETSLSTHQNSLRFLWIGQITAIALTGEWFQRPGEWSLISRSMATLFVPLRRCPRYTNYFLPTNQAYICQDSPLFTILAFVVAVTILKELCEYTIKIIVGPTIRPDWRTLHEWSGRTWEDLVFDRGQVSVMWLKENIGQMKNILGVALQQKKGLGLPRVESQKELCA